MIKGRVVGYEIKPVSKLNPQTIVNQILIVFYGKCIFQCTYIIMHACIYVLHIQVLWGAWSAFSGPQVIMAHNIMVICYLVILKRGNYSLKLVSSELNSVN